MTEWLPRSWQCSSDPTVRIDLLNTGKYAIRCEPGLILGRDCRWEVEPEPSDRDEEFYLNYRFESFDDAKAVYALHRGDTP